MLSAKLSVSNDGAVWFDAQNLTECKSYPFVKIDGKLVKQPSSAPDYYSRGNIECWDVIEAWELNYNLGAALKYVCRAGHKTADPVQDLEKAISYLQREISRTQRKA